MDSLTHYVLRCLEMTSPRLHSPGGRLRSMAVSDHCRTRMSAGDMSDEPDPVPDEDVIKDSREARMRFVSGANVGRSCGSLLSSASDRQLSCWQSSVSMNTASGSNRSDREGSPTLRHGSRSGSIRASVVLAALGKSRNRSRLAEETWKFLEIPQSSRWSRRYHRFMRLFVLASLLLTFNRAFDIEWFDENCLVMEIVVDVVFVVETLVRFWSAR